jgi:ribosomal protein S27E
MQKYIQELYTQASANGTKISISYSYKLGFSQMYYIQYLGTTNNTYLFYFKGGMYRLIMYNLYVSNTTEKVTLVVYSLVNINYGGYISMVKVNSTNTQPFSGYGIKNITMTASGDYTNDMFVGITNKTGKGTASLNISSNFQMYLNIKYSNIMPFLPTMPSSYSSISKFVIGNYSGYLNGSLSLNMQSSGILSYHSIGYNINKTISIHILTNAYVNAIIKVKGNSVEHPAIIESIYLIVISQIGVQDMYTTHGSIPNTRMVYSTYDPTTNFYSSNSIATISKYENSQADILGSTSTSSNNVTSNNTTNSTVNSYLANKEAMTPFSSYGYSLSSSLKTMSYIILTVVVVIIVLIIIMLLLYRRKKKTAIGVNGQPINQNAPQISGNAPQMPPQNLSFQQSYIQQPNIQPSLTQPNVMNNPGNATQIPATYLQTRCNVCGNTISVQSTYKGVPIQCPVCKNTIIP